MSTLLIASENPGKLRELQQILSDLPIDLVLPSELGLTLNVEETGSTYAENAALKAVAFTKASRLAALADDSGLEVDALGGAPGLFSRRYGSPLSPDVTSSSGQAGGEAIALSDAERRVYLLNNLHTKARPWTARFRAAVAIATPEGEVRYAEGTCEGEIVPEERGSGGFGYDPIFVVAGTAQTMAELSDDTKNRLSHRGRAVSAAIPILRELLRI